MTGLDVDIHGTAGTLAIEVAFRTGDAPLVIAGPNGAGKTRALMMILGASQPARGRVTLGDTALYDGARGLDVPIEARRIGFLPHGMVIGCAVCISTLSESVTPKRQ